LVLKKTLQSYTFLLLFSGVIIAFDQWTKYLVRANLAFQEIWAPWDWLIPYARIVHWHNFGAAFGMLPMLKDVFAVLAVLVAVAILYYFPQVPASDWTLRVAMGLQFAGAVGNLIDRITQGYVTDFVSVGNFPVFNVADASISTGVAILVVGVWIKERQEKAGGGSSAEPADAPAELPPLPEETPGE
jgi:signal peptidase II